MTTITERLAIAAALMLMASNGFAQNAPATQPSGATTTPSSASTGTNPTSTTGAFDSLSPGNQKVARALFLSQHPTTGGPAPLSLNQIAALKGKEGWGEVFKQMRTEGLTQAKNLGQVVSHYEHHLHNVEHARGTATYVTNGNGRMVSTGSAHENHGSGNDDDGAAEHTAKAVDTGSGGHHDNDSMTVASSSGTASGTGITHGTGASSAPAGRGASAGGGYAHGH